MPRNEQFGEQECGFAGQKSANSLFSSLLAGNWGGEGLAPDCTLRQIFNNLASHAIRLRSVNEQPCYLPTRYSHRGRPSGLSLWRPGADWLLDDGTEPVIAFLPSRLWMVGLGNLGQAFAWALAALPYNDPREVQLILQDFDRVAVSNESTSVLTFAADLNRRKARVVAQWLDARGFDTYVNERRFGVSTRRAADEPSVALCGVDNALARATLEKPGFGLVVEVGLGAGPEAFRSLSLHTFPSSLSAEEIWSKQVGQGNENVQNMPAYQALKQKGLDTCGMVQLASRTVGLPFVGLIAACLVLSEVLRRLIRRLNGGCAFELLSGSVCALDDIESVAISHAPYAFGHLPASKSAQYRESDPPK